MASDTLEIGVGADRVENGDVVLALASSGLHANGYSLVRHIVSSSGLSYTDAAAEFGGAPTLWALAMRSPRALVAYTLGQAYISFFRLQGPYASERAWAVASGELFEPVLLRGLVSNVIFLLTTAAFGTMNLVAHALELPLLMGTWFVRTLLGPSRT